MNVGNGQRWQHIFHSTQEFDVNKRAIENLYSIDENSFIFKHERDACLLEPFDYRLTYVSSTFKPIHAYIGATLWCVIAALAASSALRARSNNGRLRDQTTALVRAHLAIVCMAALRSLYLLIDPHETASSVLPSWLGRALNGVAQPLLLLSFVTVSNYAYCLATLKPRCPFVGSRLGALVITCSLCVALPLVDALSCSQPVAILPVHLLVHVVYVVWLLVVTIGYVDQVIIYIRRLRRYPHLSTANGNLTVPAIRITDENDDTRSYRSSMQSSNANIAEPQLTNNNLDDSMLPPDQQHLKTKPNRHKYRKKDPAMTINYRHQSARKAIILLSISALLLLICAAVAMAEKCAHILNSGWRAIVPNAHMLMIVIAVHRLIELLTALSIQASLQFGFNRLS